MDAQWPAITTEVLPWHLDVDELDGIPRSRRRKIGPTYEAAVPLHIAEMPLEVPIELSIRIEALVGELAVRRLAGRERIQPACAFTAQRVCCELADREPYLQRAQRGVSGSLRRRPAERPAHHG